MIYLEILITMKTIYPSEEEEQVRVVAYLSILENQGKVLWWCASSAWQFQKSWSVKAKMKRTWVRPWMPDLFIVFRSQIVLLELKREKGWYPTEEQKKAIEAINKAWDQWNCSAFIAYWFQEAKKIIDWYI